MGKTRDRLVDATRRLLAGGTNEADAVKSLVEIGIGRLEAKSIIGEAKALAENESQKRKEEKSADSFWDAPVGTYFGDLHGANAEGGHKKIFSFIKWLAK